MRRLVIIVLVALIVPCVARAQAQPAQPPKPGPEVQRLSYFAGSWNLTGEVKAEPVGKYSGTVSCEWFEGGFVLICKGSTTGVNGPSSEMHIFSFSPQDKAYNWYSIGNTGASRTVKKMTVDGKKWICDAEGTYQGKPAKYHYEWIEESPTVWTYGYTRSVEGGAQLPIIQTRVTKAK
jgi:hypothetical protein